jgi:hypothetical protein
MDEPKWIIVLVANFLLFSWVEPLAIPPFKVPLAIFWFEITLFVRLSRYLFQGTVRLLKQGSHLEYRIPPRVT